jgi:hypothetical protein
MTAGKSQRDHLPIAAEPVAATAGNARASTFGQLRYRMIIIVSGWGISMGCHRHQDGLGPLPRAKAVRFSA